MSAQEEIIRFFQSKGLTKAQAAGIAGNVRQESSYNPNTPGGGLFQDIGSRAPSGTGSAQHQLEAAWRELQGTSTLAKLKATKTPQEAARVFSEDFERPGEPDLSNREKYAAEAYEGKASEGGGFLSGTILAGPLSPLLEGVEAGAKAAGGSLKIPNPFEEIDTAGKFFEAITKPSTWLRIAEGIGGIVLFMTGLKTLTRGTPAAGATNVAIQQTRSVKGVAVKAGKVVAGVAK